MFASAPCGHLCNWLRILILGVLATNTYAHFGSCEDHSVECGKWASWGFCRTNPKFMALNCPVSCQVCLDPGCFDRHNLCSTFARRGLCRRYPADMSRLCPHSCNFCRIPETAFNSKTLAAPDFECGRPVTGTNTGGNIVRRTRPTRQIIFPDELGQLVRPNPFNGNGIPGLRAGGPSTGEPSHTVDKVDVTDSFCGATLIHERFLVTAAHCVLDPENPVRTVRLGELDFSKVNEANSKPADYNVKLIIVHPEFRPDSLERYNDIALIETEEKVQFNDVVYPFCLPRNRPLPNSVVTGSGFGFVNNTHRSSNLQEAELKVVDSDQCVKRYEAEDLGDRLRTRYPQLLQGKDILCAAFPGRDACQGDSGGPLFQNENGRRFLVGVVALGISCRGNGISNLPGFYISVADHIDFIDSVVYGQEITN